MSTDEENDSQVPNTVAAAAMWRPGSGATDNFSDF
jgi:hypothetical protein